MSREERPALGLVTGASTGIGLELARQLIERGLEVIVVSDEPSIEVAARELGPAARPVRADLATQDGNETLVALLEAEGRAPAGAALNTRGGGPARVVDTDLREHLRLVRLNVESTVHLAHDVAGRMVAVGEGGILLTSSIASQLPGPLNSTYAASKAFVQAFAHGLRGELEGTGVHVTALLPGPTDTRFFERAGMEHTRLGSGRKDDPADVARDGLEALRAGDAQVVAGSWINTVQVAMSDLLPDRLKAAMHKRLNSPR